MSLCHCNFYSQLLSSCVNLQIILPSVSRIAGEKMTLDELYPQNQAYRTLYLLHGMYEDESVWVRRTNIERYAAKWNLAVVMPAGQNSFYTDMKHGLPYFSYLTEELPRFVKANFPVSSKREDTYIAGLSMGGYGACKAAFLKPEQYEAFASLSGALELGMIAKYAVQDQERQMFQDVFGDLDQAQGGPDDLFAIAETLKQSGRRIPRAYLACGTEDPLCYHMNRHFKACLEKEEIPFMYEEGPGAHEWNFWDQYIQRALCWLLTGKAPD